MKRLFCICLLVTGAWAQGTDPGVRHPNETDKAAIFGYMINARTGELKGRSFRSVYAQCIVPVFLCSLLLPLYFRLTRRTGLNEDGG
jgi:hypothetical protein